MHILFAGGGTAGHINPALSIAGYIKEKHPESKISYIGTSTKLESKLVPESGYDFYSIDVAGFYRSFNFEAIGHNILAVKKVLSASSESRRLLKELKPDIVVGTGGYVSGPVLREAAKLGIKTAIHEQNAFPGVTTKMLSQKVDRVMLAMPEAEKHLKCKNKPILTGNPVRSEFLTVEKAKARKSLDLDDRPMILSFGGSLGAEPINNAVTELIIKRFSSGKYNFYHCAGRSEYSDVKAKLENANVALGGDVKLFDYIANMAECMAAADLVIGRAGAITLSEIEALGKASILIPSPYVAENHQFHNAMTLKKRNAAEVIEESELTGEKLISTVDSLLKTEVITETMGKNAKKGAFLDSSKLIYKCLMDLYTTTK